MSRSGYVDDYEDPGALNRWRANVERTLRGKRGQTFLRDLAASLDAMPVKELISGELVESDGSMCAIGTVAASRGIDLNTLDPSDWDAVAGAFRISSVMAREIVYENDEAGPWKETPADRWKRMRAWVDAWLRTDSGPDTDSGKVSR